MNSSGQLCGLVLPTASSSMNVSQDVDGPQEVNEKPILRPRPLAGLETIFTSRLLHPSDSKQWKPNETDAAN